MHAGRREEGNGCGCPLPCVRGWERTWIEGDRLHEVNGRLLVHDARVELGTLVGATWRIDRLHIRRTAVHVHDIDTLIALTSVHGRVRRRERRVASLLTLPVAADALTGSHGHRLVPILDAERAGRLLHIARPRLSIEISNLCRLARTND